MINKEYLATFGVMPVVVVHKVEDAVPIARALYKGGITGIEITLRTPVALDAIRAVKDDACGIQVGVGTVTNIQHVKALAEIGVDFAVSPGMTESLVKTSQDLGVNLLPGVASPSEVMTGMEWGLTCFKLFPAVAVGGLPLLKSMGGPLPHVSFCPTGGLTEDSFVDFLNLPNVPCVGGTWLVPAGLVEKQDWAGISAIAERTLSKIGS